MNQDEESMTKAENDRRAYLFQRKISTHFPYIALYGPMYHPLAVIADTKYTCNSITEAVDICMKAYTVFQKPFCIVSAHVWNFIEVYGYGFERKKIARFLKTLKSHLDR